MPVLLRMTTRVCHSKSIVELDEKRQEAAIVPYQKKDKFNPVPAISRTLHTKVEANLKALEEYSNQSPLNYIEWGAKKIGIVAAGVAYQYAREVFGDQASYLKLGLTFPLPMEKIRAFAKEVEQLIVVEELEPIMEKEILAAGIACTGKDQIPREGELNPDILRTALTGQRQEGFSCDQSMVAKRPPVLCAGCPHRGFFHMVQKRKDMVVVSDIGCYALAPKDIAICMGGGFSVAHGAQKIFNRAGSGKRCIGIMGDSTFFHSGMTSMLEAVYNNSNVLLTVLDNRITGMTGHQENPGSGYTLNGEEANISDIARIAGALGVKHIRTINPLHLKEVEEALEWGMGFSEPAVLITRWPCALKKLTSADKEEFGDGKAVNRVDPGRCIGCRACIKTGCPALIYHTDTKKVEIDRSQCTACDICSQVCPKHAIEREEK